MYLLDTNVLSELITKKPDPRVVDWVDSVEETRLFLSVVTIGENRKGIDRLPNSNRKRELEDWFERDLLVRFKDRILPLDTETMLSWGRLIANLEREGRSIPAIDSLIAATSLHHGLILVTRNVKDFLGVNIEILNPFEDKNGKF